MDTGSIKARLEAFDREHGESISPHGDAWKYFADGARREINPLGALIVPEDPRERAKWIIKFYQMKAQRALKAFEDRKHELSVRVRAALRARVPGLPVSDDDVAAVEDLRGLAVKAREELTQAEDKHGTDLKTPAQKEREREATRARDINESILARLGAVKL